MINSDLFRGLSSRGLFGSCDTRHVVAKVVGHVWGLVVRITLETAFPFFLGGVRDLGFGTGLSSLACGACSLLGGACRFGSVTVFAWAAFLQEAWWAWNYAILNLSCCLLYLVDVLLQSIRNLCWMLFPFWLGCVVWWLILRWVSLIWIQIRFWSPFRGCQIALGRIRMRGNCSWSLSSVVLGRLGWCFTRRIGRDLIFIVVRPISCLFMIFISSTCTMRLGRPSLDFIGCEFL